MRIDLNSDLGESFGSWTLGNDAEMITLVSSANVACGFHAGDPRSILETVQLAAQSGVTLGAHVSYPDLVGFGRRFMDIEPADLSAAVTYQIGALQGLAQSVGTKISYVKPHGALYHTISHNESQAAAVIKGVHSIDPDLPIVHLAGAKVGHQIRSAGMRPIAEAFADRAYEADGSLTPRSQPDSVLHDPDLVAKRMLRLVSEGIVEARDGQIVELSAETICVHGDSASAVDMASALRQQLDSAGFEIASFIERSQ